VAKKISPIPLHVPKGLLANKMGKFCNNKSCLFAVFSERKMCRCVQIGYVWWTTIKPVVVLFLFFFDGTGGYISRAHL
jgi:hypothetical protein